MRILVTGANGFIGLQIVAALSSTGHHIICAVRKQRGNQISFPNCEIIFCDFNQDTTVEIWEPRLKNIDVVINCVGILQQEMNQSIKAIHELAPTALFNACCKTGVRRIIHLSALGVDPQANTAYADTKLAAENNLMALNIDWVILRPSLIYAQGSFGGTSLIRAMAALPCIIPVIGDGQQFFQPIYMDDLVEVVKRLIVKPGEIKKRLDVVGSERVSYLKILTSFRQWLNIGKAKIIHLPLSLVKGLVKIGGCFGITSLNITSLNMLMHGNTTSENNYQELIEIIGFTSRAFSEGLFSKPSYVQDRWHAKLFFIKPLLRLSLAALWIGSGIIALIPPLIPQLQLIDKLGGSKIVSLMILLSTTIMDILLGIATLFNWKIQKIGLIQVGVIIIYTVICSIYFPNLWLEPFAPLLKNIPILMATLVMIVIAEER